LGNTLFADLSSDRVVARSLLKARGCAWRFIEAWRRGCVHLSHFNIEAEQGVRQHARSLDNAADER
jgi:hypothetical protein